MLVKRSLLLTFVTTLTFLVSCSSSSPSNLYFTGDGKKFLIQESELPSRWQLSRFRQNPIRNAENWTTIYETTLDPFGFQGEIAHSITVFDREEDAIRFFEAMYQEQVELAIENPNWDGTTAKDFLPPQKYLYKSPIANQFAVVYAPESLKGTVIGYRYQVLARYGNVFSWFVTVVEDESQTGIGAEKANVLSWLEVQRLLQLIDKKFQQAS